ncbi:hypothetical protein [Treponema sp.]|uniref:hypothetical protein n=1 Tax=Treponema sp. TaxID=166 RepID=UPI00298E0C25|nr:hypothetical protein [Treponema sp.]MCQ2242529.1 hypothetical protein [Treponema sp.]
MRSNLTVHVPQNQNTSYSLFAKGLLIDIPKHSDDDSELILKFQGGKAVVLFYYFEGFKRAYIVTGWESEKDGEKCSLPGVDGDLCILYTAFASKVRLLDYFIKYFSKEDEYALFRLPLLFWYRFSTLIQCKKGKLSYIANVVNRFSGE